MKPTRREFLAGAAALTAADGLRATASRAEAGERPLERWVWDLDGEFRSDEEWHYAVAQARSLVASASRPQTSWTPELFDNVFDAARRSRSVAGHLARHGVLGVAVDGESEAARHRRDEAVALETEIEAALAWLDPEIAGIGLQQFNGWAAARPSLNRHRMAFERALARPQVRSRDQRELLAKIERWPRSSADVYEALNDSNLGWTRLQTKEGGIIADGNAYRRYRRSADPALRRSVSSAYFRKLSDMQSSFGLLYTRRLEGDLVIAQAEGFSNLIDASLSREDGIEPGSAARALGAASGRTDIFPRWARAVGRVMNASSLSIYDLNARPFELGAIPIAAAVENAAAGFRGLGPEYAARLRRRLSLPWFHLPASQNKSAEVGVFWQVGGGHPLALMTYRNDLASSATFASLCALAMWYADLPDWALPDRREEDFPVFSNAIWFAGRLLHHDALLARTTGRTPRQALILDELAFLHRGLTYVGVSLLQQQVERTVAAGKPMTGADISTTWLRTMRELYQGIEVPDDYASGWIAESQGFYNESLTVFAIALMAAASLAENIAKGDRHIVDVMSMKRVGRGRHSQDFLTDAGLDVGAATYADGLFRRIDRRLRELEAVS